MIVTLIVIVELFIFKGSILKFQVIHHGMSSSFLDKIPQVGKELLEQPLAIKEKSSKRVEEFEGYRTDPVPEEGQPLDWSDPLFLDVYPENTRKLEIWPQSPTSFRYVLLICM